MTFACVHCGASAPCNRPGHPCLVEKVPVDEGDAQQLWEVCTDFGAGRGTYAWRDLRELERERFRDGLRFAQGTKP